MVAHISSVCLSVCLSLTHTADRNVAGIAHQKPSRTQANVQGSPCVYSSMVVTPHTPRTDAGVACRPRRAADTLRFVHTSSQPVSF